MLAGLRAMMWRSAGSGPRVPEGTRVYAIGDIHGRSDLLDDLLAKIAADERSRQPVSTHKVFLGDYIDRGPDSAGVIARLIELEQQDPHTTFLMGNHEEILMITEGGDRNAAALFDRVGGRETLLSYGVSAARYDSAELGEVGELIREHIPSQQLAWIAGLGESITIGDYMFVHAGVRPEVEMSEQLGSDLRWIRDEFLGYEGDFFGLTVVHGHSIETTPQIRPNRIGVDTGAYVSGHLTAVALEGTQRWFLNT